MKTPMLNCENVLNHGSSYRDPKVKLLLLKLSLPGIQKQVASELHPRYHPPALSRLFATFPSSPSVAFQATLKLEMT